MMVLGHRAKQTKVANRKGPESSAVCAWWYSSRMRLRWIYWPRQCIALLYAQV
jgi:hypothetical protein